MATTRPCVYFINAPEGFRHGTHKWDGLHTRHLLEQPLLVSIYPPKLSSPRAGPGGCGDQDMPIVLLAALACGFARPDALTRLVVRSRAFSTRHAVVLAAGKPAGAGRRVARRQVASNKMARRNFEIVQELEAGVSLYGTEVKSCRDGRIQLRAAARDEC